MKRILRGKNKQEKGKKHEDENPPLSDMPPPPQLPHQDPRYSQRDLNQDPRYSGKIPDEQYTGVPRGNIDFRYSDELDPKYVVEDSLRLRQQQLEQMKIQQQHMQNSQQDPRYVQQQQQPQKRSQRNVVNSERRRESDYERQYEEPQYDRRPPSSRQRPNEGPPPSQKQPSALHAASARRQQQMEQNVAPPPVRQQQQQPPRMATSPQPQQPRAAPPQQQQQQRPMRRSSSPQARQQRAPPQMVASHQENKQVFEPTQAPPLKEKAPPKPAITANGIDPVVQMERAAISRELVKQYVADIWNRGDLELIPKVCARGLRFNGSAGMDRVGHDGFSRMVQTIRGSLEDYHCEIHSMVVEGNKAFCRMRFTGRHVGQLLGYEATGKHVSWMGASEFTVVDGLIVKVWELGDMASLEHQLREATDNPGHQEEA